MDEILIPKRIYQHICVSLPKDHNIEFYAGLIRDENLRGGPVALYLFKSLFLARQFDDFLSDLKKGPATEGAGR